MRASENERGRKREFTKVLPKCRLLTEWPTVCLTETNKQSFCNYLLSLIITVTETEAES